MSALSEYHAMMRGRRRGGCTCILLRHARGLDGSPDSTPEPAEWEQVDDCPVHPYVPHISPECDW